MMVPTVAASSCGFEPVFEGKVTPAPKPRNPSFFPSPKVQIPSSMTKRCERDGSSEVGGGSQTGVHTKSSGTSIQRCLNFPYDSPIALLAFSPPSRVGG